MKKLTENHFSFVCPMVWDEMPESLNGRYCGQCRKEVFDLTNCSVDEVISLQRKHGSICGSIQVVRAAAVAVSLSAAACQDVNPRTTGTPMVSGQTANEPLVSITGGICPPEQLEKETGE